MTAKNLYLFLMFILCQVLCAQLDSIALREVTVSDLQLKKFSSSQSVLQLNDSVLRKNQPSLTSLLNQNSTIYFKENGYGMVSSPSFRGTTAQQTAVIWNGININSQLNGQTDFNTITTKDFESISIRAGGGSAIYGSSAIGGSIHLNNNLTFQDNFSNDLQLSYGSFKTFNGNYKLSASNENASLNVGISHNNSDNDYRFPGSKSNNLNGQFQNTSFNGSFGYKINQSNYLKLYSQIFDGERHFSLIFPSETKTKYHDLNTRNLIEWDLLLGKIISKVKIVALSESYQYFPNIETEIFTKGKTETFIGKYDLEYNATDKIIINAVVDYTKTNGSGSDIFSTSREIASGGLLFKHQLFQKFTYEFAVRKELTSNYKSPLLFSFGTNLAVNNFYHLKLNASRNFRIPTFNDLYWNPGGNENLKPESSWQAEVGNDFNVKNFRFSLTGFYISIENMIQWIPGNSYWSPMNVHSVETYGAETLLNWTKSIGKHQISLSGTYAYTISENQQTKKQLIYVPFHKSTINASYSWKKLSFDYQFLFNGAVFTRSDNDSKYNIDSYNVSNVILSYDFGNKNSYVFGVRVYNLWNEIYQSVESRFFPESNFNLYLNLKF